MVSNFLKVDFPCLLAHWLSKPYGLLWFVRSNILSCSQPADAPESKLLSQELRQKNIFLEENLVEWNQKVEQKK